MATIPISLPKGYQRLGNFPLDESSLFTNLTDLQNYASSAGNAYIGQICTVNDSVDVKVYKINPDKSVSEIISASVSGETYTNNVTMPENVGGLEIGTTFNNDTLTSIFDRLLYPFQIPRFSIADVDLNSQVEVGTTIGGNHIFTWSIEHPENILPNAVRIKDNFTLDILSSGLDVSGSTTVNIPNISYSTVNSRSWNIEAETIKNSFIETILVVSWMFPVFYGENELTILDSNDIINLREKIFIETINYQNFYFLNNPGYKYICHPADYPTLIAFEDYETHFNVPFNSPYIITVTNTNNVSLNYKVYRSTNKLNGTLNILAS